MYSPCPSKKILPATSLSEGQLTVLLTTVMSLGATIMLRGICDRIVVWMSDQSVEAAASAVAKAVGSPGI